MRKSMIVFAALTSITLPAVPTHAYGPVVALSLQSGSQSGSQGGNASIPNRPRDPQAEAYSRGRSLVSKKISCKKCAHPKGIKDAQAAQAVAQQVRNGEFDLKDDQRQLVVLYLKNRFGI